LAGGLAQVTLLREVMVLAGGNEFSLALGLACWLAWVGAGSLLAGGRERASRAGQSPGAVWSLALAGAGGLASLVLARLALPLLGLTPGAVPDLGQTLAGVLMVLAPVGLGLGAAFPRLLAAGRVQDETPEPSVRLARLYGWEALGAALGGALFGQLLAPRLNPLGVLCLGALAVAGAALNRTGPGAARRALLAWGLVLLALLGASKPLDLALRQAQNSGRRIVALADTPYAQLMASSQAGQTDIFAGGLLLFSHPDPERRQRTALLPLLAHPKPGSALFLGGAAGGAAELALELGGLERVTAVELDEGLVAFSRRVLGLGPPPAGLRLLHQDGRQALRTVGERYDLVVVDLPPPSTLQLNRFYSREGMADLARALDPDGVAVLTWPGGDESLGRLQARQLGGVVKAARQAFNQVLLMPGPELRILCAERPGSLPEQADLWLERLAARGWDQVASQVTGVRPDTLEQGLDPRRRALLGAALEQDGPLLAGRDLWPRALLFDPQLWGAQLGGRAGLALALADLRARQLLWPLLALLGLSLAWGYGRGGRPGAGAGLWGLGLAVCGCVSLALTALLLFAYQVLFGSVYVGLALVLAAFMLGLGGASLGLAPWLACLKRPRLALLGAGVMLSGACLLSLGLVRLLHGLGPGAQDWAWLFLLLAALDGAATGAYFVLAARWRLELAAVGGGQRLGLGQGLALARLGGLSYGLELAGGVAGALWSVVLTPTVGLEAALWLLALLNLVPLSGLLGQAWRQGGGR
jgi:spermidine synthase